MNLAWTLHRLSAMSGRELGYRVEQHIRARLEQAGLRSRIPRIARERRSAPWLLASPVNFSADKYCAAAERILAGDFNVFAMRPARLGFPPQWNRDPKTGVNAPRSFGKLLDYRDERLVGDIKYLWEPARHAELVTLAQAWRLSGDSRYARGCCELLDSWFEQCPYPNGPHWSSSLELALRLVNWSLAWNLLDADQSPLFKGAAGESFQRRWLENIYRHCDFIAGRLSRHSSANNHLFGELTGLFIAAVTWPIWKRSAHWRDSAHRELEHEALAQNGPDGVNREQANWYHYEVAEMMLIAGLAARADGRDFSNAYWGRLRAMLEYVASIMDVAGHVPNAGDADDAVIVRLDPDEDADVYRSLLAAGAVLFDCPEFKMKAGAFDDKAAWLLGDSASQAFAAIDVANGRLPMRRNFDDAGCFILGQYFETSQEIRIIADAGPLGFLSIAAHGHADALSFTLSAAGRELLIDPGTFAYHTQKQWRDYFRGTSAHNTVRIDGCDQSVSGGNFLWTTHAHTRVIEFSATDQLDRLVAEHDGYRRLADPVTHRRELRFDHSSRTLTVIDELFCQGAHAVELFWHFAEDCLVQCSEQSLCASSADASVQMQPPEGAKLEMHRGREAPPLGWSSRCFDQRSPCTAVVARTSIRGNARLVTEFIVATPSAQPRLVNTTTALAAPRVIDLADS